MFKDPINDLRHILDDFFALGGDRVHPPAAQQGRGR
jgi:hypothetical protein